MTTMTRTVAWCCCCCRSGPHCMSPSILTHATLKSQTFTARSGASSVDDRLSQNTFRFNSLIFNLIPLHLIITMGKTSATPFLPGGNAWPSEVHGSPYWAQYGLLGTAISPGQKHISAPEMKVEGQAPKTLHQSNQQLAVSREQSEGAW